MTALEDLVRSFRADQRPPRPDAIERVYADAVRPPRAERWLRRPLALVPVTGAVAAAVVAAVLFWPSDSGNVLERAAAAVAPSGQIVHFRFEVRYEQREDGTWVEHEVVAMHDWALFRDGKLVRARRFISSGPPTEPPTDEDTAVVATEDGLRMTSWVDGDLRRGPLPEDAAERVSVATYLRSLYDSGRLVEAARDGETIVLRAAATECREAVVTEVVVDAESFLPRRMVETVGCARDGEVTARQVLAFTNAETLPENETNLRLLEVGDWPADSAS